MPNSKISQLPSASVLEPEMLFPVVDTGILETQQANLGQLLDLVGQEITILTKTIVTADKNLLPNEKAVFANNSLSQSVTVTLPSISIADSREYYIIKADSLTGSVFISGSSPNLINGQTAYELNGPYQSVVLIHDNTNWFVF